MKVEIPKVCPCCNSLLERVNMQLFCRNDDCSGRSDVRIANFCKKLKIKGLALKSIEKLNINSISELYSLDKDSLVAVLGKNGEKIYMEVQKSLNTDICDFIGALGIPLVGQTTAKKIKAKSLSEMDYSELPNKAKDNFTKFLLSDLFSDLKEIKFNFANVRTAEDAGINKTVCLTGKFSIPKKEIEAKLNELGYSVVDSVTKAVNLLITNDINSTSSKIQKARQYNIHITTLEEILK